MVFKFYELQAYMTYWSFQVSFYIITLYFAFLLVWLDELCKYGCWRVLTQGNLQVLVCSRKKTNQCVKSCKYGWDFPFFSAKIQMLLWQLKLSMWVKVFDVYCPWGYLLTRIHSCEAIEGWTMKHTIVIMCKHIYTLVSCYSVSWHSTLLTLHKWV